MVQTLLPNDLRTSPPPSSAQKVHVKISQNALQPELLTPAWTSTPRTSTPSQYLFRATPFPASIVSTSSFLQLRPIIPQTVTPQLQLQPLPLPIWMLTWKLMSMIPARQGRGEVVRLLITIRRRWRTEGPGEKNGESGEIVRELQKGLTKWKGFEDIGWTDKVGR